MIEIARTKLSESRLLHIMLKASQRNAFMGCALSVSGKKLNIICPQTMEETNFNYQFNPYKQNSRNLRAARDYGLQAKHAYTITKVVQLKTMDGGPVIPLVRIRNPHGNHNEWKGPWSDE